MDALRNNNNSNNNNNHFENETMQRGEEDLIRTAFEYSFPTNDDDDTESNKSTPYFTPMEFLQSPFEFPTPRLEDVEKKHISTIASTTTAAISNTMTVPATAVSISGVANNELEHFSNMMMQSKDVEIDNHSPRILQSNSKSLIKHLEPSSPNVQRKFRRFSLYERRSCSPQHLIIKNASSVECTIDTDKENTKPKFNMDKNEETNSDNNSPSLILDETGSPRILTSSEAAMLSSGRLTYSPKLLSSINNLHLASPLGVISSAGYKNGNYFKFPEIDHVVQDVQVQQISSTVLDENTSSHKDNQSMLKRSSENSEAVEKAMLVREINSSTTTSAILPNSETKRNRKNKNNLTIKIINNPSSSAGQTPHHFFSNTNTTTAQDKLPSSPSLNKPKTPTIKTTKEKALSLDSAPIAKDCVKTTLLKPELNLSCDEIDSNLHDNKQLFQSHDRLRSNVPNTRSTSLSQLPAHSNINITASKLNKTTIRRRIPNSTSADWQLHQRKCTSFNIPDITKKMCENRDEKSVVILKEDEILSDSQSSYSALQTPSSGTCASTPSSAHRTPFKHNPLLHNSNTNLKTLPEFLTLVEFSTPTAGHIEQPFKQKSMDLPGSTVTSSAPAPVKAANSSCSSSTNLLQRRGSNHSLTLNLHGSCSNLLGSCRSGLSISNYSLGSVGNSTNNLNSKSSCNLNITTTPNSQTTNTTTVNTSQGAKQCLFRRRGSNQSLTLTTLTATSCGNLNSFASQNSLNVDRSQLTTLPRPITNTSLGTTPRRGLLERRGSNQSLTLNMSSSFGGIGSEKGTLGNSSMNLISIKTEGEEDTKPSNPTLASNCFVHSHQRRFFSSESLNRNNSHFADLNLAHKRNDDQVCFGSVTDLKPNNRGSFHQTTAGEDKSHPEHFDFQESAVCTCTGVRNIMTKPLSPQTTSEEFKIYLANIQMLQNASNALNQHDLIKLNYIFDNSYASNTKSIADQSIPILSMPASHREAETPPAMISNSEDCEIIERYLHVVKDVLPSLQPDEEEQKRIFRSLHKEFWDLPLNHQEKPMVFGSQTKNRYKTILPNENSRVILEKESKLLIEMAESCPNIEEGLLSDIKNRISNTDEVPYINANYIKGPDYTSKCYIATQGPLPNTIYEFWLMIYQNTKKYMQISKGPDSPNCRQGKTLQQYYQKIVMLTNFMENNRQKCSIYFPVDLNEIFISTPRNEVVQPSELLTDFFNTIIKSNDNVDEISMCKSECDTKYIITMDTLNIRVDEELKSQLPNSPSFIVIKNVGIVRKNGFSIRKLIILYCATYVTECEQYLLINKFICYHYWYPDWPDHRSPRDINTLLDISLHVMNLGKCESEFEVFNDNASTPSLHINAQSVELYQQDIFNAVQPLPVIHCSAGIGRTGCLTAILNGIRQVRQSLAYSLTTMATNAAKQATASQVLSPVDFRLPKNFLEEDATLANPLPTDIDCSYTRNTLLYIRYILKMEQKIKQKEFSAENDEESFKPYVHTTWRLPSLAELPKMANIFVDVLGIVCNLRLQRGGMVQNSEQYELIHRAICLYLKRTFALKRF
ncbi:protein tyrosine phosphatase-ERK/Enhancer of Ras1 isoform 1-T3 [Cochliomyia hominivorax]